MKKQSGKWHKQFQDVRTRKHGKGVATTLMTIGDTHWNTAQGCLASTLCARAACEEMAFICHNDSEFPKELNAWSQPDFWHNNTEAELLIRPFCDSSFLMQ